MEEQSFDLDEPADVERLEQELRARYTKPWLLAEVIVASSDPLAWWQARRLF